MRELCSKKGFTLVEVMVTVAIVAVLSAVAIPAYVNYVNRMKQGEAAHYLMVARLEQEEFYADNGRYASTIGCLPSFGNSCGLSSKLLKYYTFSIESAGTQYFKIAATRKIYPYAPTDKLWISSSTDTVKVENENALKFSLIKLLFD